MSDTVTYHMRVCAAVLRPPDQVLIVRERIKGQERINLPGGVPHYGETLESAVIREVYEETGHHIVPLEIMYVAERRLARWDDVQLTVCFYAEVVRPGAPPPESEVSSVEWMQRSAPQLAAEVPESAYFEKAQRGRYVHAIENLHA